MIIPAEQLSSDALNGLIEEYITREGTDYGSYEVELSDKVSQVMRQIRSGKVLIIFDAATETVNLLPCEDY